MIPTDVLIDDEADALTLTDALDEGDDDIVEDTENAE